MKKQKYCQRKTTKKHFRKSDVRKPQWFSYEKAIAYTGLKKNTFDHVFLFQQSEIRCEDGEIYFASNYLDNPGLNALFGETNLIKRASLLCRRNRHEYGEKQWLNYREALTYTGFSESEFRTVYIGDDDMFDMIGGKMRFSKALLDQFLSYGFASEEELLEKVTDANLDFYDPDDVWLTKAEAAEYVGCPEYIFDRAFGDRVTFHLINGERMVALSVIRDIIARGLSVNVSADELKTLENGKYMIVGIHDPGQGGDGRPETQT